MGRLVASCGFSILLLVNTKPSSVFASTLDGEEHQGRNRATTPYHHDDFLLPKLDPDRTDALGWTDAHHAAYGSVITTIDGIDIVVPQEKSREFLEQEFLPVRTATTALLEKILCQTNHFGQTTLHLAVRQDNMNVVSLCIDRKISCRDYGNRDGDTALHYAAAWGRRRAAEMLLEDGADPTVTNDAGQTPMDDALLHGYDDILDMMKGFVIQTVEQEHHHQQKIIEEEF